VRNCAIGATFARFYF